MPEVAADFTLRAWRRPEDFAWVASPQAGVERVLLDRVGDEVAVATSLVRYAPGSRFPEHEHGLGEEYLVLEGEFGDEHRRYPPGTYVRNPAGSRHSPFSEPGCVIWVKLRQFHAADQNQVVADANVPLPRAGCSRTELHRFRDEVVTVIAAAAATDIALPPAPTVQEVLVVGGAVHWREWRLGERGWIRVPAGEGIRLTTAEPSRVLHKTRPAYAVPPVSSATSAASAER